MFTKLLIANRGESACRIISTARRMGIRTVAVYSDADAGAAHVAKADEAVRIGPARVSESYLRGERIVQAALDTGAEAIHPGYGFLSENPEFVEAVEAAGITFIGPSASAIRAMGLKDAAKNLMEKAGVPVVPGYHGEEQEAVHLAAEAEKIGYPVLIKARAGGGGKGMRLVERASDFSDALASAQREAQASFGDAACLIEKYIQKPRHIEMQVLGDAFGNVIHLFERDCSLQRRHQKVIEEAPAPGMTGEMREAMGEAAVSAAKAIGYQGAGTVEFIVDGSDGLRPDRFWFMEMNTRLQVEHPVSEAITRHDFVEMQLRIAAGEPLPVTQNDLTIEGWAFEARLYAEDATRDFLPATGRLEYLRFPQAAEFQHGSIRVDAGVRQGDDISPYYDPMIAKIISHANTREAALDQLAQALSATRITGLTTNLHFLHRLSRNDQFRAGMVDTGLIARDLTGMSLAFDPTEDVIASASLIAGGAFVSPTSDDPWELLRGWRQWNVARQPIDLTLSGQALRISLVRLPEDEWQIAWGETSIQRRAVLLPDGTIELSDGNSARRYDFFAAKGAVTIFDDARAFTFEEHNPVAGSADASEEGDSIIAPMPGLVREMKVSVGETVVQGQKLVLLEAMKMEHALLAPRDGTVAEIMTSEGSQVSDGDTLVTLESENE